jgi:hypothetical protein
VSLLAAALANALHLGGWLLLRKHGSAGTPLCAEGGCMMQNACAYKAHAC